MSSCRMNLLKLIDLAIGSPNPGSVNFHLLHKILYILALRDGSTTDANEIELSNSSATVDQRLLSDALRDGSQTRLTVQRITNGSDLDGARLRLAGSRIMFPCDGASQKSIGPEPDRIESQMSAMSSMVSDLEERVQEISRKPSSVCEKDLDELRKRIDGLECMVEQQIAKHAIHDTGSGEQPQNNLESCDEITAKMWDSIRLLESRLDALLGSTASRDREITTKLDNNEELLGNVTSCSNDPEFNQAEPDIVEIIRGIESRQLELESNLQLLKEQIFEENQNAIKIRADDCHVFPQISDQLSLIEQKTAARMEQIEHLISRLFQEKADDVAIESRIRQSIRLTSNFSLRDSIASNQEIANQHRDVNDRTLILTEKLKFNQDELYTLREQVNSKASQDDLQSSINAINAQLLQLHIQIQAVQKSRPTEMEQAAGSKRNPIRDVRCISCDRNVTMDTCIEVVPKAPLIGVSRTLKPNLRRQLHEARRSLDRQATVGGPLRNMNHFEKVYKSIMAANHHRCN